MRQPVHIEDILAELVCVLPWNSHSPNTHIQINSCSMKFVPTFVLECSIITERRAIFYI